MNMEKIILSEEEIISRLNAAGFEQEGDSTNLQVTGFQVFWFPETRTIRGGEICQNGYGSVYGTNCYSYITLAENEEPFFADGRYNWTII